MEGVRTDLRYALRTLGRSRGWSLSVVLTLALGIGANTAIFTVINGVLLRPLPYRDSDRLVRIYESLGEIRANVTAPDYLDWRRRQTVFESLAATTVATLNLTGSGDPERLAVRRVSADYFATLGVRPLLGRGFSGEEDAFGAPPAVVLTEGLWRRRFGADPGVIDRQITLGGRAHTVVGVMPASSVLPGSTTQLWVPLALTPDEVNAPGSHFLGVVGRLRPGTSREQAEAAMKALAHALARVRPQSNSEISAEVVELRESYVRDARPALLMLLGAVAMVLLIACANVAHLLLARATTRVREFSVRAALGASRWRIVRQQLAESALYALAGGAGGLLLACWGVGFLTRILPAGVAPLGEAVIEGRVLAFTLIVSLATGMITGLVPAFGATRTNLNQPLKESSRATPGRSGRRLRAGLVMAEVALALVLLVGSGLLLRSFLRLRQVDPGFDPRGLLAVQLSPSEARYGSPERTVAFYQRVVESVSQIPGVAAAALVSQLPLDDAGNSMSVSIPGRTPAPHREQTPIAFVRSVSSGYFGVFGIRLLGGRWLAADDRAESPRVGLVNQTMARRYWPNGAAIGQRVLLDDDNDRPLEIVGVVSDVRHFGLDADPEPELFVPFAQTSPALWVWTERTMTVVVRGRPHSVPLVARLRSAIEAIDRDVPLYHVTTMEEVMAQSVAARRATLLLLGLFAILAFVLASVGIYATMAFTVSQRRHEIGVRMALGADRREVMRLILTQGLGITLVGIAIGVAGALALTRLFATVLFGITATDPLTFVAVAAGLVTVAMIASWQPARRAAAVDPMTALRTE